MIKVIGTGYNEGDLTLRALKAARDADIVIAKSSFIPNFNYFKDLQVVTLDDICRAVQDPDELNAKILETLLTYKDKDAVYAVGGAGCDDITVINLNKAADIEIIAGVGAECAAFRARPDTKYIAVCAADFVDMRAFYPDTSLSLIIKGISNKDLAGDVKLKLLKHYDDDIKALYICNGETKEVKAVEIDSLTDYNYSSVMLLPPVDRYGKTKFNFSDLMEITYRLRDPDGCKWDRAQDHKSIRGNAIEEAYELVEAIDLNDIAKMTEETGDVLLQGVFHAVIGESDGSYDINDVLNTLCRKLIDRHTHIFGDVIAEDKDAALKAWEAAKAKEKGLNTYSEKLDAIASNLPALIKAYKAQKTAKKSGFDWEDISGAVDKVGEELQELLEADKARREEEGGDLLFAAVNVLRFFNINPELALNKTVDKFVRRFRYMEDKIRAKGLKLEDCALAEMDYYWEESKNEDRHS
ncbi:MAG: nucleoside triphosphate pyrophosphohydrolase [Christensenellales bacterium]|jgi:tetrapyrrole methylase family protein/MazG family protein